jgi:hypothetical protein
MSRIVPLGNIPDSNIVPDGTYHLKVVELKSDTTKVKEDDDNPRPARLFYRLAAQIVAPAAYKGQFYREDFYIGTDEDPDAEQLDTWSSSFGARNFKKFLKATGVAFGDEEDDDSLAAAVKGQEYLATIVQKIEPEKRKDGSENPYKGQARNNVTGYWIVGEKEPALNEDKAATPKAKANGAARPQPRQSVAAE